MNNKLLGLFALGLLGPMSANAAATVTFEQVGSNVVATLSGSINLSGLTAGTATTNLGGIGMYSTVGTLNLGTVATEIIAYTGVTQPGGAGTSPRFGSFNPPPSTAVAADSGTGDALRLFFAQNWNLPGQIYLASTYDSGDLLAGTTTFPGKTLAELGLQVGDISVYPLPSDTFTVRVGAPTTTPARLSGFYPPVDSPAVATNLTKAGQAIPLKFYAETAAGPIVNLTSVDLSIVSTGCVALSTALDAVESYATLSGASLQNMGGGYYQYNWKTAKSDTGCRVVTLELPAMYNADALVATFEFRK